MTSRHSPPGWLDRLSLGPARRRRGMLRQLRALDREYAAWAGPATPRRRSADPTARVSLLIAIICLALLVVVQPGLLPGPVRDAAGLGPKRLAAAPRVSGTGSFAFVAHQPGDPATPVAYDPCRSVDVRINPEGGPPGAVTLVREAMAEVAAATGLELHFAGLTGERPHWHSASVPSFLGRPRPRPVLVSFASATEVPELSGDVAGIGGSVAAGRGVLRYVTGGATLDADAFARLAEQPGGRPLMRAIVLHELGHVVGLAHVSDERELMNARNVGRLDFGTGDRLGLARLGSGSCA